MSDLNGLQRIIVGFLTTPSSDLYLSKMLRNAKSPTLEPFDASDVDVTTLDGGAFGKIDIRLKTVDIVGISNVQIQKNADGTPDVTADGPVVTFHAVRPNTEAPPPDVPTELKLSAQWYYRVGGVDSPTAPVVVTIDTATLIGKIQAAGDLSKLSEVVVTFQALSIDAPTTSSNIKINLDGWNSPLFKDQVQKWLNEPETLAMLIGKMNGIIGSASVLSALSKAATSAIQHANPGA